jgi:hypothetical protein
VHGCRHIDAAVFETHKTAVTAASDRHNKVPFSDRSTCGTKRGTKADTVVAWPFPRGTMNSRISLNPHCIMKASGQKKSFCFDCMLTFESRLDCKRNGVPVDLAGNCSRVWKPGSICRNRMSG